MDFLERTYFYDKNMIKDETISMAGNCYQQLFAIIMKNILKYDIDYYSAFLKDLSFYVRISNNNLLRSAIKGNATLDKKLYEYSDIKITDDENEAIKQMNNMLDAHGYVVFRTVDDILPFTVYYNAEFHDMANFIEDGHVMMMIGKDDKYYYFVDQLTELNLKKMQHPKNRPDIGMYEIEKFKAVFKKCLIIKDIVFHPKNMLKVNEFCDEIIKTSIKRYFNNLVEVDDMILLKTNILNTGIKCEIKGGRSALIWICDFFSNNSNDVRNKVYNTVTKQYSQFDIFWELKNGMTGIIYSRKVLLNFFEKKNLSNQLLLESIKNDINVWESLRNIMIKNYYSEQFLTGSCYKDYIENLLCAEDNLFKILRDLYY